MFLNPHDDGREQSSRHISMQRGVSASLADQPCSISADQTTCDCAQAEEPGISSIGDQPQQQQICAPRQGKRHHRRVDDCYREEPEHSQVGEPMRHRGRIRAGNEQRRRTLDRNSHIVRPRSCDKPFKARLRCSIGADKYAARDEHAEARLGFPVKYGQAP